MKSLVIGQTARNGMKVELNFTLDCFSTAEMSWYRESYILTLCDEPNENNGDSKNDSFDVSQMETGRFESFAEVRAPLRSALLII